MINDTLHAVTFPIYTAQKSKIYIRLSWSMAHGVPLHFLYCSEIWHLFEISLVKNPWHAITFPTLFRNLHWHEIPLDSDKWNAVTFPILFRNLTFTWDSFGQWHMACRYISYTIQKFDIYMRFLWTITFPILFRNLTFKWDFLGQWHMACRYIFYTVQKFDIYIRFLWTMTHGMSLHFLYCSEIWHLLKIPLVNDAWHAVHFQKFHFCMRFPWSMTHGIPIHFLCYSEIWHLHADFLDLMTHGMLLYCPYCSEIWHLLHVLWSKCSHISHNVQNLDTYIRFTIVFLCEKVHNM